MHHKNLLKTLLILMAVLALCSIAIVYAEEGADTAKPLEWPEYLVRGTLDNGLNYVIMEHQKPKERILAYLVVEAGSIQETDKERGIAHYMEHMGFNGTEHFPPGELVKYFASIGVDIGPDINAFTSFDRTAYMFEVSTEKEEYLDKGLTALCDYASGMLLLPEEIDKERGVILEELRLSSDVDKRVYEQEIAITFKDSLYSERLPIGIEERIKAFTPEDFQNFYKKWYRPDIMSLIVIGDCKAVEVEKKIKSIFSEIPVPEGESPDLIVPFKPHEEIYTGVITDPELEETSIAISYLRDRESFGNVEDYRRELTDDLIFEMLNMRFNEESYKTDTPLIYGGGYYSGWLKSFNRTGFWAYAKPGEAMKATEVIMDYAEGLRNHGFSPVERKEAQAQLIEALRKAKEETKTREAWSYMYSIMDKVIHDGIYISPEQKYELAQELLPTVTEEEIKARIAYLLEPVNMSVIIESPEEYVKDFTNKDVLSTVEKVLEQGGTAYEAKELNYSYDYSTLSAAEVTSRKEYEGMGITEIELSNGLTVLLKPTEFEKDTVRVSYVSKGGQLLESPDTPGMFDVAQSAWSNGGTEDLSQFEVDRLLKGKNIHFHTGGSALYGIRGSSARGEFEELCQWMWQYLTRPGYSEEGIHFAIKVVQDDIRYLSQYQEGAMMEAERKLLLPNHPFSVTATEEDVAFYTDPDALKRFQFLSCVPSNSELTIVGAFDLEEGIKFACKYFGSISPGENPEIPFRYFEAEFPQGNTKRIIYKGMENRCLGSIIFPGCMTYDEDKTAMSVLGKIMDLRCWEKVREEKSLAYAAYAYSASSTIIKGHGTFEVGFGTDPDKVDELINTVMGEIKDIQTNGPTEEELDSAKKILISSYEEKIEENYFWFGNMQGTSIFEEDKIEDILKEMEEVPAITAEQVKEAAIKYLTEKNNVILLAFPEDKTSEGNTQTEEEKE